ncbi:hypothetical protein NT6N_36290 [Oceaniferula spumae]|uniref:Uncharacterized protein n=1 Tax=Oceaniferula spumae TaxID=2979115 RepID=A0AAT9FRF9_9BACT
MFDAKKLTEDQVAAIKGWAEEGAQLADIQKRMEDEMEFRLTYMDTRFLVLDLGIEIRNLAEEEKAKEAEEAAANPVDPTLDELTEDDLEILPPTPQGSGKVRVTVDGIARPGVMASGRVTFADSQGGTWYVDEMGRLGVDPDTEGYRPTEADILAFQKELQAVMDAR